jgi:hypothetical protein
MNPYKARRYHKKHKEQWNEFVRKSKNGSFLFDRNYMDYHADRFEDCSLFFYDERDRIAGLLPASRQGDTAVSHGGLTYGGVVCDASMKAATMLRIFEVMVEAFCLEGITRLVYKPVPHIFHRYPAEEDLYALYKGGARLTRRDASSVLFLPERLPFSKGKREGVRKALRNGVRVELSCDFAAFFEMGRQIMIHKYKREPVHTAAEMALLQARFPDAINLQAAYRNEQMLAGAITYTCPPSLHIQYMYSLSDGQQIGALDLVLDHIINHRVDGLRYLSFGVSTEDDGRYLNEGLIHQKELFGARTVVHDFYEIDILGKGPA